MLTPNPVVMIQPPKVKKVRVPPITISNQTTKQVRELMVQINVAQTDYMMRAIKTGVQLLCSTEEGFRNIVNALKQSNVQFYTYTLVTEQPVKVILSGLSVYDTAELETELLAHGVIPVELKLFSRKVVVLEESALYLLHFVEGAVKLSELQKIKALFNTVVKWRYYDRKPTDAVQCHRCQRFGHGMRNCNLIPLCVKCGEKHLSAECKLPKKADLQHVDRNTTRASIKCANCSGPQNLHRKAGENESRPSSASTTTPCASQSSQQSTSLRHSGFLCSGANGKYKQQQQSILNVGISRSGEGNV